MASGWESASPSDSGGGWISAGGLYDQFHTNVAGPESSHNAAAVLRELRQQYADAVQQVRTSLQGLQATWTGRAGEAVRPAFAPLTDAMRAGHAMTAGAADVLDMQGGHFTDTQNKIVRPPEVPDTPPSTLDPTDTSYTNTLRAAAAVDSANQQQYRLYQHATQQNAQQLVNYASLFQAAAASGPPGSTATSSGHDVGSVGAGAGHAAVGRLALSGAGARATASSAPGSGAGGGMTAAGPGGTTPAAAPTVAGGDAGVSVGSTSAQDYAPPDAAPAIGIPTGGGGGNANSGAGGAFGPLGSGTGGGFGSGPTGDAIGGGGRSGAGDAGPGAGGRGVAARGGRGPAGGGSEGGAFAPGGAGRGADDEEHRKKRWIESKDNTTELVGELDDTVPPVIE